MGSPVTERDVRAAERRLDALLASDADDGECMKAFEVYDRIFQRWLANLGDRRKRWSIRNTRPVAYCPF